MSEREMLLKEKMEQNGIFDFKGFYGYAHAWFREEGYGVDEEKYSEKNSGSSRDITIEWKATKQFSDYFKAEHKMKFTIEKMGDVEVEIDGQKKQMNKGKIEVEIKSTIVIDAGNKWETNAWYKFLKDSYNKYVIPARIDAMREKIAGDGKKFKDDMKAFFDLYGIR